MTLEARRDAPGDLDVEHRPAADAPGLRFVDESQRLFDRGLPNAMTVDVEDYFQVSAFESAVSRDDWDKLECRIPRNIDVILERFAEAGVKGTFFTLGWVAERYPEQVRRIADEGHEIASHGLSHRRVGTQTPQEFQDDVRRARDLLEQVSGQAVTGYRAASFSISTASLWAYDELARAGYRYSSSVYPINHDHYGIPDAPRFPFRLEASGLLEVPLTTVSIAGRNWPCAGGGYFRLLPLTVSRLAIRRVVESEKMPAVFYFHPWELDPQQPRISGLSAKSRFRHYVNLGRFEQRLTSMLAEFRWGRMDEIFLDSPRP